MALNHACLPIPAPAQKQRYYNWLEGCVKKYFSGGKMAIVLDGMGSDNYPDPEIQAALESSIKLNEEIILVGDENLLSPKLKAANQTQAKVRIVHAPDILKMDEHAVEAARQKPQNSMAVGMNLVKTGEARAFVTAGNTGAAYFTAVTTLRRIRGVSRPALSAVLPVRNGHALFMDTGANADCRPEFLLEFAIMGSIYAEKLLNHPKPRVGILANGEEAGKGNELVKAAYPLLQGSGLNFVGNIEPKDFYSGKVDVLVTDGFTGNVFIKSSEAVAKVITDNLREQISASFIRKMGYLLVKPAFVALKKMLDPGEIGAAFLLGVDGYVFIGHGRSDARALSNGLALAQRAVDSKILESIRSEIQERVGSQPAVN
jgi:glycerol-3-phosphate acyltransferase PlsX